MMVKAAITVMSQRPKSIKNKKLRHTIATNSDLPIIGQVKWCSALGKLVHHEVPLNMTEEERLRAC